MRTLATNLITFYKKLKAPAPLPEGVEVLHPQQDRQVMAITQEFFLRFYNDHQPRQLLIGINPGRLGAGITGINFTGPRQLRENCGIEHPFGNGSELSAEFIYQVIETYGGAGKFYRDYFITAVSPLGFIRDGKNLNYYDSPSLQQSVTPFINDCLEKQLAFNFDTTRCICIGGEKNFKFLHSINDQRKKNGLIHFHSIIPLPHPRFILQYRRKQKEKFIEQYLRVLTM